MELKKFNDYIVTTADGFTKRVIFKTERSLVFVLNFMPGQALPPHKHPGSELFIQVLSGNLVAEVDGECQSLTQENVMMCKGEESLSIRNESDELATAYVTLHSIPDPKYTNEIG